MSKLSTPRPGPLYPQERTLGPNAHRRVDGLQGRSGHMQKISPHWYSILVQAKA